LSNTDRQSAISREARDLEQDFYMPALGKAPR
jgi:hypothetical protein